MKWDLFVRVGREEFRSTGHATVGDIARRVGVFVYFGD